MLDQTQQHINGIIKQVRDHLFSLTSEQLRERPAPGKWSKIEILGHLVDSGINNLQRFTEVQFMPRPFKYLNYKQDDLVKANNYQEAELNDVFGLYQAINIRILAIMEMQTEKTLAYEVVIPNDGKTTDLKFIMTDYADHMEHHLEQILR
ncbi:MAG: DinB family protein [Bacteroidota bacterium]